jgi:hypothetical protein
MFYANFIDSKGNKQANLYHGYSKWFEDSFSPDTIVNSIIDFKVIGKSYAEKKEYLRNLAIDFQSTNDCDLSYGELADIYNFFEVNGKRYGLIREFRENAIC